MISESAFQANCIKYANSLNILCINIHGGGWGSKGVPDLILCINGRFVAIELKVGSNTMSPAQVVWKDRINASGGRHYCPRSLPEFKEIINEINKI